MLFLIKIDKWFDNIDKRLINNFKLKLVFNYWFDLAWFFLIYGLKT